MLEHARQLLKDSTVASIAPTSKYCVKKISRSIDFENAKLIIEFGPGDGALTRYLLARMRADARLVLIETNDYFVNSLKKQFNDPRVTVIHDTAEDIARIAKQIKIARADYIVSGIPFSMISHSSREEILKESSQVLKNGGKIIIYQALMAIGSLRELKQSIRNHFELVSKRAYLLNLPPLYVYEAVVRREPLFI